jgi:predicted amidophosphoribosyltransferase
MEETLTRQIKVFCPQHQSVFEVAGTPKIVCEIREHVLSDDFPNSEFWEYCADCQTFFPSELEVGGKTKIACPQCERPTVSRFVCGECKVISFDSGEDTKGKIFHLDSDTFAISPACPGCLKDFSNVKKHLHKCAEIDAVLSTTRETCPFCKKETVKPKAKPAAPPQIKCPKCKAKNEPDSFFCNDCGEELRSNPTLSKRGTSTAKTQLLGSICPNCGASNDSKSVFCNSCGQALKTEKAKPQQQANIPPTVPSIPQSSIPTQVFNPGAAGKVKPAVKPNNTKGCAITVGVILGGILLCAVIQGLLNDKNRSVVTVATPAPSSSSTPGSTTPYPTKTGNSASTSLPDSFNNEYTGTIGGKGFTMSLTRNGTSLKGTASTYKTDHLYGTIESDGSFKLKGYENDDKFTGNYNGRVYSDGSISGTWTNPQGGQGTSFSLTLSDE